MFTLLFLLSAFVSGWISASVSQYQTVEAQPGEEVTLQCNNISKYDTQTFWSRLVNRTKISCVVVKLKYASNVTACDGYEQKKYEVKSDISTVFLNIKKVDSSDSGLYYCGIFVNGIPVLTPIHLKVNGKITVFFSFILSVQFALFCFYCTMLLFIVCKQHPVCKKVFFIFIFFILVEICQNKIKTKVVFISLKAAMSHMMMAGRVKGRFS